MAGTPAAGPVTCPCGGTCPDVHVHDVTGTLAVEMEIPVIELPFGLELRRGE